MYIDLTSFGCPFTRVTPVSQVMTAEDAAYAESPPQVPPAAPADDPLQPSGAAIPEMLSMLKAGQDALAARLDAVAAAHDPAVMTSRVDALCGAVGRLEQINTRVLREFQNGLAAQLHAQDAELRRYRELHAALGNTRLLTRIAGCLVTAEAIVRSIPDEKTAGHVATLAGRLRELLEDEGVVLGVSEPLTRRSIRQTTISRRVPTGDPALDGLVAASDSPSFSLGSVVLAKEDVQVYRYDPALAQSLPEPEEAPPADAPAAPEEAPPHAPADGPAAPLPGPQGPIPGEAAATEEPVIPFIPPVTSSDQ